MPKISAKTWNRFITTNLCVVAEVMGSIHKFDFEKHHVSVLLPKPEHADRGESFDEVARTYTSDTKEPQLYSVAKVDVEITVPKKISVPEEALYNPPKQFEHFSEDQKQAADTVCEQLSGIGERAFQYWLEVIRWASNNAMIGQPDISGVKSGWTTYLMDSSTNHKVWAGTINFTISGDVGLTKKNWEKAAEHLQKGYPIPMHIGFLHDAKASTRNGQYEKAIIELAMACEIYLRYAVLEFIPKSTPKEMKTYIEEANMNKYVSQFFKGLVLDLQSSGYKKISSDISSLMSRRNSYLHMGQLHDADRMLCRRYINTAEQLFEIHLRDKRVEN